MVHTILALNFSVKIVVRKILLQKCIHTALTYLQLTCCVHFSAVSLQIALVVGGLPLISSFLICIAWRGCAAEDSDSVVLRLLRPPVSYVHSLFVAQCCSAFFVLLELLFDTYKYSCVELPPVSPHPLRSALFRCSLSLSPFHGGQRARRSGVDAFGTLCSDGVLICCVFFFLYLASLLHCCGDFLVARALSLSLSLTIVRRPKWRRPSLSCLAFRGNRFLPTVRNAYLTYPWLLCYALAELAWLTPPHTQITVGNSVIVLSKNS